jgi:hypothetical protein
MLEAAHPAAASTTRLNTLLAEGADLVAADLALARGWELVTPLPFGAALNLAVNGLPMTLADASAILADPDAALAPWSARMGERAALAARVMIEQAGIMIGVWDGASRAEPEGAPAIPSSPRFRPARRSSGSTSPGRRRGASSMPRRRWPTAKLRR